MSTQVAIRRGNTAQTAAFTGVVAELTVDTDKKVVVVHDGTTAGGNPLIKANASITTGQILTSNGSHLLALSNTGTAGTYGNASYIPVVTTDAYGRVSSVTNTAIAISSGVVTGVMTFAQGGANATSYTTGSLLTSNGTAFVSVANTGTAGTYGNAAYHPVITTDAYGRVSAVTNTLVQIAASQVTSGVLPFAQGGANATSYTTGQFLTSNGTALVSVANTGTAGTYANAAYIPVITTDAYGRVSAVTNTAVAIDTSQLTSGTVADARLASVGTAGTYANAAYVPVITTDSKGRVTAITNTAIAIDTSQLTSGTVADARLPTKGTAGTYANAAYIPVITTDAYGRVTGVTNTAVAITASQVSGGTISGDLSVTGNLVVSGTQTFVNTSTVSTNDSLIKLAANNTVSDVLDIGFYGQSNTGSSVTYHGLVRQAAGNFFLFKGLPTDPTTNTLAAGSLTAANTATIRANLVGGTVSSLASAIGIADGGTNQTSFTNGIVAYNGTALATLANTGTAGTYANAAYVPVITTDAYGRVSSVTNTAISISATAVTGIHTFAQGGTNAASYTTGSLLTSNGTAFVSVSNTGTAGTYANAAYVPVITTDAYGRISAVTNTAIAIDTSQLASGTIADARLPTKGTAGTYANAAYVPVITTDAYGRVTGITNTAIAISATAVTGVQTFAQGGTNASSYTTGTFLTSNGTAFVSVANTGTAGTYGNTTYIPVITTDAYGRVSSVTNTAISFPAEADTLQTVTTRGSTTANAINITNTTVSTSNATGALQVGGGIGVKGNVYASNVSVLNDVIAGLQDGPVLGGATNPIIAAIGNTDQYIQTYTVNYANTPNASADLVVYPNNGNDSNGWVDMGITSNTYACTAYSITGRNEGYLFMSAPGGSGTSGNLVIATDSTGTYNTIEFVTGGFAKGKTNSNVKITSQTTSSSNTTGALQVNGGIGVAGNVYTSNVFSLNDVVAGLQDGPVLGGATNPIFAAIGNTNSYVQNYVINYSNTANASADWAAYPNNGNDTSGWIDMGITSNNYSQAGYNTTGRNEGYLLMSAPSGSGTSGNLVIATDSTGTYNSIEHYPGGFNSNKGNSVLTITTQTSSTSNTTGGVVVRNGLGVRGNVSADSIIFPDNTRQTSAGASLGDALALAIALG
jgi:hypothetical protein